MQTTTYTVPTTSPAVIWRARTALRPGVLAPVPVVTLTRQRARRLHQLLSGLGMATDDRYAEAGRIAGRMVESLTALTEGEARKLWQTARAQARARAAAQYRAAAEPAEDASEAEVTAYGAALLGL